MTLKFDPPVALTIAGSDSGGGAGIQADLKTFHAFGTFGTSVVTAVTAQNTVGVHHIEGLRAATIRKQIEVLRDDLPPAATKTGMLATAEVVETVAGALRGYEGGLVVDPVMVATSGDRLVEESAVAALRTLLVSRATLVTPNLPEAEILAGGSIESADDMESAARSIVAGGARAVLIKGGHAEGTEVADLLWDGNRCRWWRRERIQTSNTHGTGCTLSAAITAGLAWGRDLTSSIDSALAYTWQAIKMAPDVGVGNGPLYHWAPTGSASVES